METDEIIALSAAVIALVATAISIWQGYLNRLHFRLSVKPHLVIHRADFSDEPLSFTLCNNGLGPAIIKKFCLVIDETEFNGNNLFPEALKLLELELPDITYLSNTPGIGEAIATGQELVLLKFEEHPEAYEKLSSALSKLKFRIIYSSMYNEKEYAFFGNC